MSDDNPFDTIDELLNYLSEASRVVEGLASMLNEQQLDIFCLCSNPVHTTDINRGYCDNCKATISVQTYYEGLPDAND